jgi:CheY-like chemotaxis protein
MLRIPRVAVLKPQAEDEDVILDAFKKHTYSLRVVPDMAAVRELQAEEGSRFDLIAVPLRLAGEPSSGITACIQIKSDEILTTTPILALSLSPDKAIIQAFYQHGADVLFVPPFDGDMIYHQIGSIARLKRSFDERLNQGYHDTGLLHPVMHAFHSMREGLFLADINHHLIFANVSARKMLGIRDVKEEPDLTAIAEQIKPFLKQHQTAMQAQSLKTPETLLCSSYDTTIKRVNNDSFKATINITSLMRDKNALAGYSVAVIDLSEVHHLANTLMQSQRTRSLCLLTTAACMRFLESIKQGGRVSAIPYLEQLLQQSPRSCPLSSTLTALLEAVDLVINPKISVKVRIEQDLYLAVRTPDFYQMMGYILLHAVEHAGISGETGLSTTPNIPGEGVIITVIAESRRVTPFQAQDQISQLIQSDFSNMASFKDITEKVSFGLLAAQKIAEKYRTTIEYQQPSETLMKVRVKLPIGHSPQ